MTEDNAVDGKEMQDLENASIPENIITNKNPPMSALNVFKRINKLAIPMALSFTFSFEVFLSTVLLNYISTSANESAAVTLISTFLNTVCILSAAWSFSIGILLSRKVGEYRSLEESNSTELENKKDIISGYNANGLFLSIFPSIFGFLVLFFAKGIFTDILGQNPDVAGLTEKFFRVYAFSMPALIMRAVFEQVMFAFGKSKAAAKIGLLNLAIGTALAVVLGCGVSDKIDLGAEGIALGFLIETYATAIGFGLYIHLQAECKKFAFFSNILNKIKQYNEDRSGILNLSKSIEFIVFLELAMTLSIGVFSGLLGADAQSAMSYDLEFLYFLFVVSSAFGMSTGQEMNREIGAKQYDNAKAIGKYGLLATFAWIAPVSIFFAAYPNALLSSSPDSNVLSILKVLTPILSAAIIADSLRYNILQQLRNLGDLRVPNNIALAGTCTGIGLSAGLGLGTSLEIYGVAVGYLIGISATLLGLSIRWHNKLQFLQENIERPVNENSEGCFSKIRKTIFFKAKSQDDGVSKENGDSLEISLINPSDPNSSS
jgi:multidrug resistance protein, MATE family